LENITKSYDATKLQSQPDTYSSSECNFEGELKKENIDSMIDIYGEEYLVKIGILTPS